MRPHSLLVVIINHPESDLNLISKTTTVKHVRDGIRSAGFAKCPQAQGARIAVSTCQFRLFVARPGQVQRRAQLDSFCTISDFRIAITGVLIVMRVSGLVPMSITF